MIVKTNDGQTFTGDDAAHIVRQMRNTEWNAPERKRDYMLEVIQRVETITGVFVDQDDLPTNQDNDEHLDPMKFLEYLQDVKLVRIEP